MVDSGGEEEKLQPVYNASLLMAFVANVFQLISVSLLFRYADFISGLGGDEWHLGWIVGIGSVGAVVFRLVQGMAIDRLGAPLIWIACIVGQLISLFWHLQIDSLGGVEIYCVRVLYATSVAGTFGAWLSFVSLQAPKERLAEVIGVVGASGFVGMAIGPAIGDWLFQSQTEPGAHVDQFFQIAICMMSLGVVSSASSCLLGAKNQRLVQSKKGRHAVNPLSVIRENNPGFILVAGMTMGLALGFAGTYLRPMAEAMNIQQIKIFFLVYNAVAFSSRLIFRRAPQVLGLQTTILLGFVFLAIGFLLYLPMQTASHLWAPAAVAGLGHSFLFPSVVAACTNKFPDNQRGVSTNLILAMYDAGILIGMPCIGVLLTIARLNNWSPYPIVIVALSCVIVLVAFVNWCLQQSPTKISKKETATKFTN